MLVTNMKKNQKKKDYHFFYYFILKAALELKNEKLCPKIYQKDFYLCLKRRVHFFC